MTGQPTLTPKRALWGAALVLGAAAAHAAGGFSITPDQETLVSPGMSAAEVRQALGRPALEVQYGNEPGPTFSYHVVGAEPTLLDIDFDADGRVASVTERMNGSGTGHAGHR